MIQSVELFDRNDRDRKIVVHEMISVCRRNGADILLAEVCACAQDEKRCYMHGTEEEWINNIAVGISQSYLRACIQEHGTPTINQPTTLGSQQVRVLPPIQGSPKILEQTPDR